MSNHIYKTTLYIIFIPKELTLIFLLVHIFFHRYSTTLNITVSSF
ncbi:hypothetical protein M153_2110005042 [Pseudoloma neurophilia]|uniref:Uncharacterized protein n=1 Tax=Pseudoloma neurophilia TaxID=146866 RepID=A0A0R0M6K1_9MICR|nr:hypothetical protein M153_2110005042 [Pseudoloma neurophilia]